MRPQMTQMDADVHCEDRTLRSRTRTVRAVCTPCPDSTNSVSESSHVSLNSPIRATPSSTNASDGSELAKRRVESIAEKTVKSESRRTEYRPLNGATSEEARRTKVESLRYSSKAPRFLEKASTGTQRPIMLGSEVRLHAQRSAELTMNPMAGWQKSLWRELMNAAADDADGPICIGRRWRSDRH